MTQKLYINPDHAKIDNYINEFKRGLIPFRECCLYCLEYTNYDPDSKYNSYRVINRITRIAKKLGY